MVPHVREIFLVGCRTKSSVAFLEQVSTTDCIWAVDKAVRFIVTQVPPIHLSSAQLDSESIRLILTRAPTGTRGRSLIAKLPVVQMRCFDLGGRKSVSMDEQQSR
jgi:hypothetical protein